MDHLDDALDDGSPGTVSSQLGEFVGEERLQGAGEGLLSRCAVGVDQVLLGRLLVGHPAMNEERVVHIAPFFPSDALSAGSPAINWASSLKRYA